jgi:hypothetical protein
MAKTKVVLQNWETNNQNLKHWYFKKRVPSNEGYNSRLLF